MFVRFVTETRDWASHERLGLFHAADFLRESGDLTGEEIRELDATYRWFNKNLPVPRRFSRSSRKHALHKAISWYKPTAVVYIRRMNSFMKILEKHQIDTKVIRTRRPGYVVYEDNHQVVAESFRHDRGYV